MSEGSQPCRCNCTNQTPPRSRLEKQLGHGRPGKGNSYIIVYVHTTHLRASDVQYSILFKCNFAGESATLVYGPKDRTSAHAVLSPRANTPMFRTQILIVGRLEGIT